MVCEICGTDPKMFVILPLRKPNGSLITIACLACAEKTTAYCKKHHSPHMGFGSDETTACRKCIEELVAAERENTLVFVEKLQKELPLSEFAELDETASLSSMVTGDTKGGSILRFIATKAMRYGLSCEEVVKETIRVGLADYLV